MQGKINIKIPKVKLPKFTMPSGKLGALLTALLVFAKIAKLPTVLSMGVMLWFYMEKYGWKMGALLVFFLAIHEYGHLYAARKLGLRTTNAIFIPFVGALIAMKDLPKTAKDEAYVGYMGPVFGTIGVLLTAVPMYFITHDELWAAATLMGFMLNLFNLIPISPLDGGRVMAAVSVKVWIIGFIMIVAATIWLKTFVLFLVMLMSGLEMYFIYKRKKLLNEEEESVLGLEKSVQEGIQSAEERQSKFENVMRDLKDEEGELDEKYMTLIEKNRKTFQVDYEYWNDKMERANQLKQKVKEKKAYYQTSMKDKAVVLAIYMALVIVLASGVFLSASVL
ncbi:site-2 protease family protein [Bacillus thuringiensis]|uniref:site-2 protease family protein n=1 Tax=Bacillus thuringiensis TaxID=1428 RepID=UPI0021D69400|nr:site-2 protease family protein [Bacillus thuringiensis]MCU7667881.1 site-2 protease family protein [Bacillus thuringiensis]